MLDSFLPPSLRLLIRLHARGFARRLFRKAKGVKGIAMSIVGLLLIVLWIGSIFIGNLAGSFGKGATTQRAAQAAAALPGRLEAVREFMPVGLLVLCVLTLLGSTSGKGIAFTAAESDFLFPGPYTRRQLILYRMARSWMASIWGAFFFGTGVRSFSVSWIGTYVVAVMLLIFIQVFSTAAALAFSTIEERISATKFRRVVIGAALALAAAALYVVPAPKIPTTQEVARNPNFFSDTLMGIVRSPLIQRLATPFKPFAYAMTAPTWQELALWSAVCLGVILVTLAIALRLDADFYESSAITAAKLHDKLDNARRGKIIFDPGSSRLRLPQLPRLGGAGPIVWRQATTALRALKLVLFVLTIACFSMAPVLFAKGLRDTNALTGIVASMLAMLTFMGGALFRFDFRGDVDRLDMLKALPISPLAVTVGQLATPMLFVGFFQACLLIVIGFLQPARLPTILTALAFLPLFTLTFTAVENLGFLMFPHRGNAAPGDLTAMARGALILLAKLAFFATLIALAVGVWWLTRWLTLSTPAALTAGWLTAAALSLSLIPLIAWAYSRFDISAEITADA